MARLTFNILGPQGSGKGTQAKVLIDRFGFQHFEAGANLRRIIAEGGELGAHVASYLDKGQRVPAELIAQVTYETIKNFSLDKDILFDGIMRGMPEVEEQRKGFAKLDLPMPVIIFIDLDKATAIERLGHRRVCSQCGHQAIVTDTTSQQRCEKCGGELVIRHDDTPEAIAERLSWYYRDTLPVIEYFREHGTVIEVDGRPAIPQVSKDLIGKIEAYYRSLELTPPGGSHVA